jgi:two-component system, NtrC family, response regulator HydG
MQPEAATEILIVEDEIDSADLLGAALGAEGHSISVASDFHTAMTRLQHEQFDVVLTDLALGDGSGLDLCRRMTEHRAEVPVVLVTGHASLDVAVEAIRAGAFDILTKPVEMGQLCHRIRRAASHRRLVVELLRLRRQRAQLSPDAPTLVGESAPMQRLKELIARLGDSDTSVLITGESGVGKELVAQALHRGGPRADGPFIAVNCAAVPATLLESELFGHVRGAFTDAKRNHDGYFVRANGGTLFLDEIAELPSEVQPKLLRALQERHVTPVGGSREVPFDVRLVTATNRDLEKEVKARRFREDLFYRVNVVHLPVPPLRGRDSDVLLLAHHFLARAAERTGRLVRGLTPNAAEKLLRYEWPGNIRELENAMERAVALAQLEDIRSEDLPSRVVARSTEMFVAGSNPTELVRLSQLVDRYTLHVLELVDGNKTAAAKILGIGRRTLYRRLERISELAVEGDENQFPLPELDGVLE